REPRGRENSSTGCCSRLATGGASARAARAARDVEQRRRRGSARQATNLGPARARGMEVVTRTDGGSARPRVLARRARSPRRWPPEGTHRGLFGAGGPNSTGVEARAAGGAGGPSSAGVVVVAASVRARATAAPWPLAWGPQRRREGCTAPTARLW
ncbi:hypothetical protein SORBI_3002G086200, partial [Sorghum bicolor]